MEVHESGEEAVHAPEVCMSSPEFLVAGVLSRKGVWFLYGLQDSSLHGLGYSQGRAKAVTSKGWAHGKWLLVIISGQYSQYFSEQGMKASK